MHLTLKTWAYSLDIDWRQFLQPAAKGQYSRLYIFSTSSIGDLVRGRKQCHCCGLESNPLDLDNLLAPPLFQCSCFFLLFARVLPCHHVCLVDITELSRWEGRGSSSKVLASTKRRVQSVPEITPTKAFAGTEMFPDAVLWAACPQTPRSYDYSFPLTRDVLCQLFAFVEDAGFLLRLLSFDSIVVQDSGQRLLLADYRSLVNVVALGQQQKASPG